MIQPWLRIQDVPRQSNKTEWNSQNMPKPLPTCSQCLRFGVRQSVENVNCICIPQVILRSTRQSKCPSTSLHASNWQKVPSGLTSNLPKVMGIASQIQLRVWSRHMVAKRIATTYYELSIFVHRNANLPALPICVADTSWAASGRGGVWSLSTWMPWQHRDAAAFSKFRAHQMIQWRENRYATKTDQSGH